MPLKMPNTTDFPAAVMRRKRIRAGQTFTQVYGGDVLQESADLQMLSEAYLDVESQRSETMQSDELRAAAEQRLEEVKREIGDMNFYSMSPPPRPAAYLKNLESEANWIRAYLAAHPADDGEGVRNMGSLYNIGSAFSVEVDRSGKLSIWMGDMEYVVVTSGCTLRDVRELWNGLKLPADRMPGTRNRTEGE